MCAVAVRAAEAFVPDRGVRTTTTSFVRRGRVGPATISVREIRRGRSISTVVADLVQDGELVTTTRLTLTVERGGVEWHDWLPLQLPPPEHCVPIDPPPGVNHFGRATALLDPTSLPFTGGEPPGSAATSVRSRIVRSTRRGWRWRSTGSPHPHSCESTLRRVG